MFFRCDTTNHLSQGSQLISPSCIYESDFVRANRPHAIIFLIQGNHSNLLSPQSENLKGSISKTNVQRNETYSYAIFWPFIPWLKRELHSSMIKIKNNLMIQMMKLHCEMTKNDLFVANWNIGAELSCVSFSVISIKIISYWLLISIAWK